MEVYLLLIGMLFHNILGQVIKTEPNKLVDGESGRVIEPNKLVDGESVPVKGVEIENKNSVNLVNGVSTTMNCKVTNNSDPVVNFRWFIVETNQTLSTSSSFQLTPNKNQNGQTLSCSADNGYGTMKSDTIILNVQYKPSVKLEPEVSGNYKIIDGNTVELKCIITDANPNDTSTLRYKWYNDTTSTLPGQVGCTVQISQNGIYTCSVSNGIGTPGISDNITVEVLFPPRVTVTPNYRVIESNTLTISCIATSNPLPHSYTWSGPNNFQQFNKNLNIASINRNQIGLYTCTVTNIMIPTTGGQQNGTGTGDTDVTVLFGPEVHVSTGTNMIDILESDKLVVDCSVIQSKPDDASINWYKPDGTRISGNILSIDNIRREEDGIYSCNSSKVLTPSIGTTKTNVDSKTTRVNVLYVPDRPNNVIYINETSDTICVEWTPGFNGGAVQSFIVQHSTDDKTWVNSSTIPDRTNNGRVDYCIEGLEPDTSYYIRVIARNRYGESLISTLTQRKPHKTAPRKADGTDVSDDRFGAGIGTGLGIALAILAIVLIGVFLYRYRQSKQKTPEQTYDSVGSRATADAQTYQELSIVPTTSNTESPQNDDAVCYHNLGPSQNATNRQVDDTTPYANLRPTVKQNATNKQVNDTTPYANLRPTVKQNVTNKQVNDTTPYANLRPTVKQNATNKQVNDTTPYANLRPTVKQNATNKQVNDTTPYANLKPTV